MSDGRNLESPDAIREAVREGYARVAEGRSSCCSGDEVSRSIGYSDEQLQAVPEGANLGLGCGNPTALAALRPGEVVVDLGAGAGFDALLAAREVGPTGRVIGVDMTDEMLARARENARKAGLENVEFRKGTIEELPIDDACADVILSNCVINLSPEKERVFREAYRVLRPGGRLMISDIVLERALPPELARRLDVTVGCVGGASVRGEYLETIEKAGFREVAVVRETPLGRALTPDHPQVVEAAEQLGTEPEALEPLLAEVTSLHVEARK